MVWEILNLRLRMRNAFRDRLNHVLHSYSIGPANSSVGRASDCSSEGRRLEPDLVDIETSLTQLVECQPHKLKAVGSISTRGTLYFCLDFLIRLNFFDSMEALTVQPRLMVVSLYVLQNRFRTRYFVFLTQFSHTT